ncbi:MAG: RNA pseudouridine synthase, partial [Eubacteriales bacterium]
VHLAHRGHPLLGDTLYGGKPHPALVAQCLHAKELRFLHPTTGDELHFTAPLPDWFETVLKKFPLPL